MRIKYFGENKENGTGRVAVIRFTDNEFDLYKYIANYEKAYGDSDREFFNGSIIGIERDENGVWINEAYIHVDDFTDFNDLKANYKEAKKEFNSLKKQATETELETATDSETTEAETATETKPETATEPETDEFNLTEEEKEKLISDYEDFIKQYESLKNEEEPDTATEPEREGTLVDNSRYKKKHNAIVDYVKTQIGVDLNKYRDGDGTKPNMTTYYDLHERNKICINWKEIDRNTQNQLERLRGICTEWGGAWLKYVYFN